MKTPLIAIALSSYLFLEAAGDNGFASTCNSPQLNIAQDGSVDLFANCRTLRGDYHVDNVINLNSCFGNSWGSLSGQFNGHFSCTCRGVTRDGWSLRASCDNGKGGFVSTFIDMNNWIGNNDGVMTCFGQNGEPSHGCG